MDLKYYHLSSAGVRERNEDSIGFWQPTSEAEWRSRGAVMVIADGVGGQGDGDIASRIAISMAIKAFTEAAPDTSPAALLRKMFDAANIAVYDASVEAASAVNSSKRMATTLTISIFRHDQIHVGHVGDCRLYHLHAGQTTRITSDHSYAGVQLKLGLISVSEAANSEMRCVLTRAIGQDPFVRIDTHSFTVSPGDFVVQCSDGFYCCMSENELSGIVTRWPEQAIPELRDLCERRKTDDNFSVQIAHIFTVERIGSIRGAAFYSKVGSTMANDVQIGQTLDGRYQITDTIAKSGMASIFKATDIQNNQSVALKIPLMRFESDPGFYERFKREQEIGQRLRHPYILRVEPNDPEQTRPYIVMEYLEGQTLGQLMRSMPVLPIGDAVRIASRICEALEYLHENDVVHRDLKPDNIMICNDGSIRIMDFGIAKVEGARRLTFGGFQPAMGTPDYMAPEQVKGKRGDARTDIYSLGAILYEMVTGHPPFEGSNPLVIMNSRLSGDPVAPRKHNPEISPQVEEIILHAMSRDLADRYASARAMRDELDHPENVQVTGRVDRLVVPGNIQTAWRRGKLYVLAAGIPIVAIVAIYLARHLHWR